MHPYTAYVILSNPANSVPRPDETVVSLFDMLTSGWRACRALVRGGR